LIGVTDRALHWLGDAELQAQGTGTLLPFGSKSGIRAEQADTLRLILAQLHAAVAPGDMALPGLRLHELKGDRQRHLSRRGGGSVDMTPVSSSAIEAVGYDPSTRRMRIRFAGGNEYDFCGVPEAVYQGLMLASSKGSYYNDNIRDRYQC
jgi:hypothetical protein